MEIKVITHDSKSSHLLTKVTFFLLGVFFTSITFAVSLKILDQLGIYIAAIFLAIIAYFGFKKSKSKTAARQVSGGILSTLILLAILMTTAISIFSNLLEGF
ncbi:hypothetical protein JKY72_03340 [Candidatus Gracilibacteria bacterium]|nr:hypothetical protein [Candidatus Gracilibacteria bacterium]